MSRRVKFVSFAEAAVNWDDYLAERGIVIDPVLLAQAQKYMAKMMAKRAPKPAQLDLFGAAS